MYNSFFNFTVTIDNNISSKYFGKKVEYVSACILIIIQLRNKENLFKGDLNLAAILLFVLLRVILARASYCYTQDDDNSSESSEFMFSVLEFLVRVMHRELLLRTSVLIIKSLMTKSCHTFYNYFWVATCIFYYVYLFMQRKYFSWKLI